MKFYREMTLSKKHKFVKYLVCGIILALLIANIFVKSYFHHDGRVSPDSAEYLSISKSILDNNSFYNKSNPILGENESYFAIWPLGYPLSIVIISKLTKLSVFWSSKVCNAIFLLLSVFLIIREYREKSYVFILCFGLASYLFIYSSTYSETGFIFSLIYFSIAINKLISSNASSISLCNILISSCLLFLYRYVGVFIDFILLFLILKSFKNIGLSRYTIRLIVISILILTFQIVYLLVNFLNTGSLTGIARPFSVNEVWDVLKEFVLGVLGEFVLVAPYYNFYLLLGSLLLLGVFFTNSFKYFNKKASSRLGKCFFYTGFGYLIFILIIGVLTHFSEFNYRFLAPATLLILFSFIDKLLRFNMIFMSRIEICLLIFVVLSFGFSIRESKISYEYHGKTYFDKLSYISRNVNAIAPNSIILKPNKHLKYILSDVIFFDSWYLNTINLEQIKCNYPDQEIILNRGNHFIKY